MDREGLIKEISQKVAEYLYAKKNLVPIGISNRHLHLSDEDLAKLFGNGYSLTPAKYLMGKHFAAKETVDLLGPRGKLEGIRVLGPTREQTQIEISVTDSYDLGVKPPLKNSGDLSGSVGGVLVGPQGRVELESGIICAKRHIHMPPEVAEIIGINDGDYVKVKVDTVRPLTFNQVLVRVKAGYKYQLHLDRDEGNAAVLKSGDVGEIIC